MLLCSWWLSLNLLWAFGRRIRIKKNVNYFNIKIDWNGVWSVSQTSFSSQHDGIRAICKINYNDLIEFNVHCVLFCKCIFHRVVLVSFNFFFFFEVGRLTFNIHRVLGLRMFGCDIDNGWQTLTLTSTSHSSTTNKIEMPQPDQSPFSCTRFWLYLTVFVFSKFLFVFEWVNALRRLGFLTRGAFVFICMLTSSWAW